jgi:hypothetical protein
MAKLYRSMYEQDGQPKAGNDDFQLGVRVPPHRDADVRPEGDYVNPGSGGMSVFVSLKKLPGRLIPARLRDLYPNDLQKARGDNALVVWCMGDGEFREGPVTALLVLRLDKPGERRHGLVEPGMRMTLSDYQAELQSTAGEWTVCEEPE